MPFLPQVRDTIIEPRYDTVGIPAAGAVQLTFFAVPLGQGQTAYAGAGVAKTYSDTNMELAGQLPNPYTFTVLGIRLGFTWNITLADLKLAINGASFQLIVGAKPFLRAPARTIPGGNGPFGAVAVATAAVAADNNVLNNGWPSMQNGFSLGKKPLVLSPTENFQALLIWPLAQAVTTTIPGGFVGLPVTIYLDGLLRRAAQ